MKAQPSNLSPEQRKPYRTVLGVLPGVEGLPRAAGSDSRAASSCLLLLPSVGPPCASRSSQVNTQVMGMAAKWIAHEGLGVQLSSLSPFPGLDLHPWQGVWSLFLNPDLPLG